MNQPQTDTPLFNRLRFVLVETSLPGNIGSTARAMKNMGFTELILVNPRVPDALTHADAIALSSGAQDILGSAEVVGSIDEALDGCNYAAAVTARLREFSPPVLSPRQLAARLAMDTGVSAALIFGNERFGLPNEIVEKCNALVSIPTNPDYSSLNLSQAVQVLAYEARLATLGEAADKPVSSDDIGFQGSPANVTQIEGMYAHLEEALIAIDFLDADHPKKLMPRLKRLFSRAQLETEEVNILRGIANQILTRRKH
jgi:tRNA/rRNA methyltransferase